MSDSSFIDVSLNQESKVVLISTALLIDIPVPEAVVVF